MRTSFPTGRGSSTPSKHGLRRLASFTLVELLVVMAILAIITAIAIPAVTSVVEGNNINRAGQQMADQINLARQVASAKNTTVEMRVFRLSGASSSGYTEVQLGTLATNGAWVSLNRAAILPARVAISESTNLSSAFYTNSPPTMTNAGPTYNATYYAYEFRPSGIMYPTNTLANYCFAVVPSRNAASTNLAASLGTAVKNYAIVQINPMTGTPLIFRP